MCAASSEQLSVRYSTKAHMNQENRQISNIENQVGITEQSHYQWDWWKFYTEYYWRYSFGYFLIVFVFFKKKRCDERRGAALCFFSGRMLQHRMNQFEVTKKGKIFVCLWVCMCSLGCQVELTIVLFLLTCCVTQMGVYLSHKLCFCSRKCSRHENRANYSASGQSLLRFHSLVTCYHTIYL